MNIDILDTWNSIKTSQSISKSFIFLKSLIENNQDLDSSNLSTIISEIFEKFTKHFITCYPDSEQSALSFFSNLESLISLSHDPLFHLNFCELYNTIGTYFRKLSQLGRSLKLFQKGFDLSLTIPFPSLIKVFLNLNIAGVLSQQSSHKKALKFAVMAADLGEELLSSGFSEDESQVQESLCIAYHTIGVQHEFLNNLSLALEWYTKAWDFGKHHLNAKTINLIENIEKAVRDVKAKFNKKSKAKPVGNPARAKSSYEVLRKTPKNLNFSRTIFSRQGKKPQTAFQDYRAKRSLSRSSVSRISIRSKDSEQVKNIEPSFSSHVSSESKREDVDLAEKPPENYFKKVFDDFDQKYNGGVKETTACQTEQSSLNPFILNKFKQVKCENFDYSFVEVSDKISEIILNKAKVEKKSVDVNKALVKSEKIDIHFKEYEIRYYINSSLSTIYVTIANERESYEYSYNLNPNDSIMEIIEKTIYSKINLVNQKLCLVDITSFSLIKGSHIRNDVDIRVSINQKKPRSELSVIFNFNSQTLKATFNLVSLLSHWQAKSLDPQYIFACFALADDSIVIKFPAKSSLELLYYKYHIMSNGYPYYLKISEVLYSDKKCYLFEGISSASPPILPLLIDIENICKITGYTEVLLLKNIDKISGMVCIRQSQIQFFQTKYSGKSSEKHLSKSGEYSAEEYESLKIFVVKIQSVFRGSQVRKKLRKDEVFYVKKTIDYFEFMIQIINSSINKVLKIRVTSTKNTYTLVFKYPIVFEEPYKDTIPDLIIFHEKMLVIKHPKESKAFVFENVSEFQLDKKINEINLASDDNDAEGFSQEFYGKILFRTAVIKKKTVRQISMSLQKSEKGEDLAEFFILTGTAKDDWQRLVIDFKTICEKSGLEKTKLTAIGYYVVKHMLFFGEGNMVCIDFETNLNDFEKNLIKVQAVIRGKLLRKRMNIEKKAILVKKKMMFKNVVWTVMLAKDTKKYYLMLVKGFNVLSKVLNLSGFSRDGIIQDFDLLLNKVILPEVKVARVNNKWTLTGIEKYEA